MAWWREARFGCFVHWGVYSELGNEWRGQKGGGYAEHIQRILKISMADYKADAIDKFNPTNFDAVAWITVTGNQVLLEIPPTGSVYKIR